MEVHSLAHEEGQGRLATVALGAHMKREASAVEGVSREEVIGAGFAKFRRVTGEGCTRIMGHRGRPSMREASGGCYHVPGTRQ